MRILELFAGIGACSKALERLGFNVEIVDAVEIDKYAIASFNAIHNTNFEVQDIKKWNKDLKDIDLITHGSPCQDFSVAGKQAGGDINSGTRSSLMYETIRIVGKLRPKYVLWENVKNLLSKKHKHNFDAYIETMNILGYNSYYKVLNAKDYGIPQNRERVYTVSIRKDIDSGYNFPNKETLEKNLQELLESNVEEKYFLSEKGIKYILKRVGGYVQLIDNNTEIAHCPITAKGNTNWTGNFVKFEFPKKEELKLRLKDMLEDEVEEKYYLSDKQIERIKASTYNVGKTRIQEKDYCDTLCARDWKDPKCVRISNIYGGDKGTRYAGNIWDDNGLSLAINTMNGENRQPMIPIKNATKKGYDEAVDGDSVNLQYPDSNTRRGRVGHQVSQTLMANDNMGVVEGIKVIGNYMPSGHDASRVVDSNGLAPTIKENHGTVTATNINYRIRKLTPKECWRLMGFDDEDFEKAKNVPMSNTQLYKQARKFNLRTSTRKDF